MKVAEIGIWKTSGLENRRKCCQIIFLMKTFAHCSSCVIYFMASLHPQDKVHAPVTTDCNAKREAKG
jgi:hypothetical protein